MESRHRSCRNFCPSAKICQTRVCTGLRGPLPAASTVASPGRSNANLTISQCGCFNLGLHLIERFLSDSGGIQRGWRQRHSGPFTLQRPDKLYCWDCNLTIHGHFMVWYSIGMSWFYFFYIRCQLHTGEWLLMGYLTDMYERSLTWLCNVIVFMQMKCLHWNFKFVLCVFCHCALW